MSDVVWNFSMESLPVTRTLVLCTLLVAITTAEPRHEFTIDKFSEYHFENGTIRSCRPILPPNFCDIGHHITPCTIDGEMDQCLPCEAGHVNVDKSYSDFPIKCYTVDCPEGTVPAERVQSSDCSLPCRCDEAAGYTGTSPCFCKLVTFQCGKDTYLRDGVCQACEEGTFKEGLGYGPCLALPQTTGSQTVSERKIYSTSEPPVTQPVKTVTTTEQVTVVVTDTPQDPRVTSHGILIAVLVIVAVLFIGLMAVCIKRRFQSPILSQEGQIVNNFFCLSNLRWIVTRIHRRHYGNEGSKFYSTQPECKRSLPADGEAIVPDGACPTISTIPNHSFTTQNTSTNPSSALLLSGPDQTRRKVTV